ncbi:CoA-disulfide reductase, partial [Rhizobium sp. KAs_5_22]
SIAVKSLKEDEIVEFVKDKDNKVCGARTLSGNVIDCDVVILSIGVLPNTELFKETIIDLETNGAIKVNEYCETNVENVYAG